MRSQSVVLALCWVGLGATSSPLGALPEGFHGELDGTVVSAGFHHTCALESRPSVDFGGALRCWGFDEMGQASPPHGHFIQVSSGHLFSCAIAIDETVTCWGQGPPSPKGLFLQISCGEFHACGLTKESEIKCWGGHSPVALAAPPGKFVQVSAGKDFSCALGANGLVACWGEGRRGCTKPPTDVQFRQVSASMFSSHACGVLYESGDVVCWGDNRRGQAPAHRAGPFVQVTAGNEATCAIGETDAHIECWGTPMRLTSTQTPEAPTHEWDQVTSGHQHVCAVNSDSGLQCWGPSHEHVDNPVDVPFGFLVA